MRVPSEEELAEHYSGYKREDVFDSPVSQKRRREVVEGFSSYRENNRLLDVGCGSGFFLDEARRQSWETYGTEFTTEAVEAISGRGHRVGEGALLSQQLPDSHFDVVIYSEVIEHINNQLPEFKEVRRVLRRGGLLYVTTPNYNSLERRFLGERWNVISYPEHLVYFTIDTLQVLMKKSGFEPLRELTTGVSPTRIRASLSRDVSRNSHARDRKTCLDERLRGATEGSLVGGLVKSTINSALNVSRLGKTIRAWYTAV